MPPTPDYERAAKDIPLAPNEFIWVLDTQKGDVRVWVGPCLVNLTGNDKLVVLGDNGRFVEADVERAKQMFSMADESSYLVLENPSPNGNAKIPETKTKSSMDGLAWGKSHNMPGPVSIPLWPGQRAKIIPGHILRTNQYLVLEISNPAEFEKGMKTAVIQRTTETTPSPSGKSEEGGGSKLGSDVSGEPFPKPTADPAKETGDEQKKGISGASDDDELAGGVSYTQGQRVIIKGTRYSYFIPPTGGRVVPDQNKQYVREAITLETMEYCLLLDENGKKRFVCGPAVVFPKSTETFVFDGGQNVFRALELNDDMGIHIKVIEECEDDNDVHEKGEELFITGKSQRIYFPRPEHAIIQYTSDDCKRQDKHFAVVIPKGEGRYVLDKKTGEIQTVTGPRLFLADPRSQVHVVRGLTSRLVQLLYPGNKEALSHNVSLQELGGTSGLIEAKTLFQSGLANAGTEKLALRRSSSEETFAGEHVTRREEYTPPRSIKLDTRFQGAVGVSVYEGFAIQVVSKTGAQRVVVGPKTVLLEYDEGVTIFRLLTGKPKSDQRLLEDVYLRISNNRVSDIVSGVTKDFVEVRVPLSYTVNFLLEHKDRWFKVENYIQLLVERMRSLLRNIIAGKSIEEIHDNGINIIRDAIIGVKGDGDRRPGRLFDENGMLIKEVQIDGIQVGTTSVDEAMKKAEIESVNNTLALKAAHRSFAITQAMEGIKRDQANELAETKRVQAGLTIESFKLDVDTRLADARGKVSVELAQIDGEAEKRWMQLKLNAEAARFEADARVALQKAAAEAAAALFMSEVQDKAERARTAAEADASLQETLDKNASAVLARKKAEADQVLDQKQRELQQELEQLVKEGQVSKDLLIAMSEKLAPALKDLGDKTVLAELAKMCAPIAMFGKDHVAEIVQKIFGNAPGIREVVDAIVSTGGKSS